jgi:hypothetical protein
VRIPAYAVHDVLDRLTLNPRELERVVYQDIRRELVRLKQADLLAAAEASRLAAGAHRPKNALWLRLTDLADALIELPAARLARTAVSRADRGSKTQAHVT